MRLRSKIWLFSGAFFILAITFSAGFYFGVKVPAESKIVGVLNINTPSVVREEVDFAPFWQAWSIAESKYVGIDKIKRQDMVYGAISGLLKSLGDPYTVFFPPKENKDFQDEIQGSFEGVGMEIGLRKNIVTVIAPLKGTPADRAGILAGDKIIKIDDTATVDMGIEDAVHLIRGPQGTKVKITVLRNGDDGPRVFELTRDVITMPVLDTDAGTISTKDGEKKIEVPDDIFVIRLHSFSENSSKIFRNALRQMEISRKQKLILDLRNNPGGYLEASVQIASWFLPQGLPVVSEDFGKGVSNVHRSYGYNVFNNVPMVVLVNEGSASASEILAGALRDYGIAKLVGQKTFGKGSVQEFTPLTSDTSLKITVARWLTPNGHSLNEGGLEPDYKVEPTKEGIEQGRDEVMEKAVELLKNALGRL